MYTMITLSNVFNRAEGNVKIAKLKDATQNNYHNLEFALCPVGGSFDITVQSDYEFQYESGRPMTEADAQTELKEVMIFVLMNMI